MADVTENDLRGAIKALANVIAPAIDRAEPLAGEQLRLVLEYLEFLRGRFAFLPLRERYELATALTLARSLSPLLPPGDELGSALVDAIAEAEAAHGRLEADMTEHRHWTAVLSAITRETIRAAQHWPDETRSRVEHAVIDLGGEHIEFERAWFLPLGLDPAPADSRNLDSFLGRTTSPT